MRKHPLPFAYCLLLIVYCLAPSTLSAQQLLSSRGEPILPQKGNWGVMVDAMPFLQLSGNLSNNTSANNAPAFNFPGGYAHTLVLKKYKSEKKALRIKFTKGSNETKDSLFVVDLGGTNPDPSIWDYKKITKKNFAVGIGFQKARGIGRLQGYSGMEALLGFPSTTVDYSYGGGPLTQFNWIHTNSFSQGRGVIKIEDGKTVSINVHFLLGAEYFFAPRLSLSAEYSWGLKFLSEADGTKTSEEWNFSSNKIKTTSAVVPGNSSFSIDNDNNGGFINLAFYF